MTPEARHLLAALRAPEDRDDRLLASLTQEEWDKVAALAISQRVGPYLLSRAARAIPPSVTERLQRRAKHAAIRALQLQAALREFSATLRPEGVQLVALKGMHLALDVYPSAALREMCDIDVLVRPEHLATLLKHAAGLGYTTVGSVAPELALKTLHELQLTRGEIRWDIHWRLARHGEAPDVEAEVLMSRSQPLRDYDNVRALSLGDLFIHVCGHAAGRTPFEQGLRSLCDIMHIIVHQRQLNWHDMMLRSQAWQCKRSVLLTVAVAEKYLGLILPADLQTYVDAERPPRSIMRLALEQAVAVGTKPTPIAVGRLLHSGTVMDVARQSIAAAFLSDDELRLLYPWHRANRVSRIAAIAARATTLVKRYGWQVFRSMTRRYEPTHSALNRRHLVSNWLQGRRSSGGAMRRGL